MVVENSLVKVVDEKTVVPLSQGNFGFHQDFCPGITPLTRREPVINFFFKKVSGKTNHP